MEKNEMGIEVVNRHHYSGEGIYIGRGTIYGNIHEIGKDGTREEVIQKFKKDLWYGMEGLDLLGKAFFILYEQWLKEGKLVLICSCAPKPCHGDVIKNALHWYHEYCRKLKGLI